MSAAHLFIDLEALATNYRLCRDKTPTAHTGAVVKADAYGLGMTQIAQCLAQQGCRTFFVALLEEGMRLRRALNRISAAADIYILNGLTPKDARTLKTHRLRPCLSSPAEVEEWSVFCEKIQEPLPAALHIDTGMNRLGLGAEDLIWLRDHKKDLLLNVCLVMSHLACGAIPDHPLNALQLKRFHEQRPTGIAASLANSAGICLGTEYAFDLTRPGLALYGGNPFQGRTNPFHAVVSLTAPILQCRWVTPGQSVGYDATWVASQKRQIATIALGYADSILIGGRCPHISIHGHLAPVVGRVSMDLITADVTNIPDVRRGTHVQFLGEHISLEDLTQATQRSPYEILTSLGKRYKRHYQSSQKESP